MRKFLRKPGPKYLRLAHAMTNGEHSFAKRILAEVPDGAHVAEVEVRYVDATGRQIGETFGFQLLTPAAEAQARRRGDIISEVGERP